MRRLVGLFVHNWPLKVAAVVLATLLYAGFAASQSVQEFPGTVQIVAINQDPSMRLTTALPQARDIRYFSLSDPGARASTDSFQAQADLANVDPEGGPVFVPVKVESVDPRFIVDSWEPREVLVTPDPVKTRTGIPVEVVQGPTPSGLDVRPAVYSPETVTVIGPASVVDRVARVEANVAIEPSGLDIDRDVDLIPVDAVGDRLTPVDVDPTTAHVTIAVFKDVESRPLPVTPVLSGSPAAGYDITAITVDPSIVSVEGDADAILGLVEAPTDAVSVAGVTQDVVQNVGLNLPEGVQPAGGADVTVRVTVTITPAVSSRGYEAGVIPAGVEAGLDYHLSTTQATAVVGGPVADLDGLDPATFTLLAPVAGLGPGTHVVTLTAHPPAGLTLVSVSPPTVTVTVTATPTPQPSVGPAPSAFP